MSDTWTAHDVLVFTCRDKFPDHWMEADDFAAELVSALSNHRFLIVPVDALKL